MKKITLICGKVTILLFPESQLGFFYFKLGEKPNYRFVVWKNLIRDTEPSQQRELRGHCRFQGQKLWICFLTSSKK